MANPQNAVALDDSGNPIYLDDSGNVIRAIDPSKLKVGSSTKQDTSGDSTLWGQLKNEVSGIASKVYQPPKTVNDPRYPLNQPGYNLKGEPVNLEHRPDNSLFSINDEGKQRYRDKVANILGEGPLATWMGEIPLVGAEMLSAPEGLAAGGLSALARTPGRAAISDLGKGIGKSYSGIPSKTAAETINDLGGANVGRAYGARSSATINGGTKALPPASYIEAPPVPIDRPLGGSVDINQPANTVRNIRNQGKFAKQGEFLQQPDGSYLDVNTRKVYDSTGKLVKQRAGKTVEISSETAPVTTGNILDDAGEVIRPSVTPAPAPVTAAPAKSTKVNPNINPVTGKSVLQKINDPLSPINNPEWDPQVLEELRREIKFTNINVNKFKNADEIQEYIDARDVKAGAKTMGDYAKDAELKIPIEVNPVTGKPRVPTTQDLLDQAMGLGKRLMNEEEGSLDLSGFTNLFKATEDPIHNIKQAVIQAALKGGRVDLASLAKQFEGKIAPEEFDKAVKDVIKSGEIQKAQGRVFKTLDDVVANVNRRTDIGDAEKAKLIERINAKNVSPNGELPNNPSIIGRINNETKTILTAYDLSAPGRQGKMLWNTKAYWTSFDDMFKAWGSEKAYNAIKEEILNKPLFMDTFLEDGTRIPSVARKAGLELPDVLSSREERFAAGFAEKWLPGVKRSELAYTAFLNKLRSSHFETLVNNAKKQGLELTPKLLEDIADTINQATGRGNLKDFLKSAETLNAHMFAPKYTASRFRVLDPRYYYKLEPFARKEALKQIAGLAGLSTAMNGLYQLAGADTKMNPFSDSIDSEFMKGKFGNTRIDPNAGVQQPYVLANRLIQNSYDMYVNGNRGDYGKFKKATPIDTAFNFALNKLNPVESIVAAMLRGTDFDYQPFELKKAMLNRTVPIMMQDMKELYDEDPSLLPFLAPQAILGDSLQTYTK